MERAFVVRGNLSDPSHIELDEPMSDIRGPVEVTVRPVTKGAQTSLFESSTQDEWEREFHGWIQGHDRTTPIPAAKALSRQALYDDRQ